jgi:hypothetical protein
MNALIEVGGKQIRVRGDLVRMARLEADMYQFVSDPEAMIEDLQSCGTRVDLFTFVQKLTETKPKYSFPMEWDNLAVLPVSTFDEWWTKQLGFKARNKAKQAEKKGAVIREVPFDEELARGIWEVYNESPVRQGMPNRHFGKSFEQVYAEEATFLEHSIFIGAYYEGKMIGFIKLVADEDRTQAGMMNIVSMVKHRDKAPTNALVVQAVRACAERHIPHLVYSRFAYPNKPRNSLTDFKERNGFERVDLPRYYVPLTPAGKAALGMGLHRKLVERLPESVVVKLRGWRNSLYKAKFHTASEAFTEGA